MNPAEAMEAAGPKERRAPFRVPKCRVVVRWQPVYVAIAGEDVALLVAGLVFVVILILMTHQWR